MRYISLAFILFLMWWSWSLAMAPNLLSEDTHIGIQEDLRRVITEYIQENLEGARDLKFEKFWTETIDKDKVKATFSYSFESGGDDAGPSTRIGIDGHAILNRAKDEDGEFDVWSLDELYVLNNKVEFKDGVLIRAQDGAIPGGEAPASDDSESTAGEH